MHAERMTPMMSKDLGRSRYQRSVLWIFLAIVSATIAAGTLGFISTTGAVAQTTGGEVGERDESFDAPGNSTTPPAPSGDKPQSKLWFNDGTWWGSLFDNSPDPGEDTSGEFHIFRFDWETRDWSTLR